ncbi:hypothetical protein [Bifidobacterium vansinderenii]|uniref:Uncharacterized protein n=1 Tax=Bifidobacterium vansinderenii TaxID=1984871 RepID=A0A229VVN4_9BIFI|nr:hypothetical protein [Bifidobacterium vansinderenii]OXM99676.1 hypothetical protein Tam10B_2099 [Bifidobacterium vansinderenii]
MSYPLDNLGDYNKVRDALHAVGGNANVFYAQIEQNAAPKYVGVGILIGGALASLSFWGYSQWQRRQNSSRQVLSSDSPSCENPDDDVPHPAHAHIDTAKE